MTDFAPSVQLNNETLDFFTESLELDQSVFPKSRMKSRIMNAESSVHPEAQECPIQLGAEIVARNVLFHGSVFFWFLAERDDDASDDER